MKLRKVLAGAMALVMVAGSLLVGPVEAKAALVSESKVYDATAVNISATEKTLVTGTEETLTASAVGLVVDGSTAWNSAGGDHYPLTGDFDVTIEFYNDAFIRDAENWSNFVFEVFNDANQGYTFRADRYGWNFGLTGAYEDSAIWNWEAFATLDNAVVSLDFKKVDANIFTVTVRVGETVIGGYKMTMDAAIPEDFYVRVGSDGGKIEVQRFIDNTSSAEVGEFGAITWSSSDTSVATVDATGKVTAVAPGTANIIATSGDKTATCAVTVSDLQVPITGIDVTTDKTEIKVGNTAQLTTTINPEDTTDDKTVTYTSSDDKIAKVDATGKVTAVAPGKATITASVLDGAIKDTVEITVPAVAITDIKLTVDKTDLEKGDIVNVVATVNPADTTEDKTITWTSSNEKVATVDANGTVTAVGGGNATITAAIGDIKAEVTFKVTAQETVVKNTTIDDITVDAFLSVQTDGIELKKGHTYTIKFTGTRTVAGSANLYEAPCYFVYTNSENKFNTADYKEVIFARGDVWCWFNGDTAVNPDALPEGATFTRTYPADWTAWTTALEAGGACEIVVKYDGKTVTATYTVGDANTVASFPVTVPSGSKLYLGLTGEKVTLTDITVADEYVTTITGKGDVNMVLPIVLVLLGGAVVLVASKKRFA